MSQSLVACFLCLMPVVHDDLPRLRELLYSREQAAEQSQAALLILESASPHALDMVAEGLRRWDRPDVFQALAAAVRTRRDMRFAEPLLRGLACEQPAVRQAAQEALTRLDSPLLVARLLTLGQDANTPVGARAAAVSILGRSHQKSAVPALLTLLSTSDSAAVRQSAAAALGELTGMGPGRDASAWRSWWEQHQGLSEAEWQRLRLEFLADRSRRLQQDLARTESQLLQAHQQLYAKIAPVDRPTHFRNLLQSEQAAIRAQAVAWIVESLPESAATEVRQLTDLLLLCSDDGVESVQRPAVLALEKIEDPRAFDRLLTLLSTGSATIRAAAARGLGRSRSGKTSAMDQHQQKAIAALEKALTDSSLTVVAEAAESLGNLGVPEAAPILAGLLQHPSESIRQAAARGLEQTANPRVLDSLYAGLADPAAAVRFGITGALARVGGGPGLAEASREEILRALRQVLVKDGDPGVRSRAATVLGDLGGTADLPLLWQRVTGTEDNRVQVKAWSGLIEILARSGSASLVLQWDQALANQKMPQKRVELLSEIRQRWLKIESARPGLDAISAALVQALLGERKWGAAAPLALDLSRRAGTEADLRERLRYVLIAGHQAVEDGKRAEAQQLIHDAEELLPRVRDLGAEFEALKKKAAGTLPPVEDLP